MKLVIDTSNNNPISPAQLSYSKAVALIAKATEGTVFQDRTYEAQRAAAIAAGVRFGAFTYIHWNDPGQQYKFFLDYAKPRKGDIQPVVDAEDPKASIPELAKRAYECLEALEDSGYTPILYASASIWQSMIVVEPRLKRFRVWEADYPGKYTRWFPRLSVLRIALRHGVRVVMWQWTDKYSIGSRHFDASRLFVNAGSITIR